MASPCFTCPKKIHIIFMNSMNRPFADHKIMLSGREFVTDGSGEISYDEGEFGTSGKVIAKRPASGISITWPVKLPASEGHYVIPLTIWGNSDSG